MKKFNKNLLKISVLLALNSLGIAQAQFLSLHQNPITYTISSRLENGQIISDQTNPLTGFRDQFTPTGTPGCVMGYSELRSLCQTVQGGFGFILNGYTYNNSFKVYIPEATTFFGLSGYLPQNTEYAVVARMGAEPSRTAALTAAEYQNIKSTQNINTAFDHLQAGEEMIFVHDGGGNISLSGTARLAANPVSSGKWLYVRVINGDSIYNLNGVYEVNLNQYRTAYNALSFGIDGDPLAVRNTATVTVVQQPVAPGPAGLTVKVEHTDAELAANAPVSYWVAAHIPVLPHPLDPANDQWFFLFSNPSGTNPLWGVWTGFGDFYTDLPFSREIPIPADKTVQFPIDLQFSAQDFKNINAKIYLGYRQGNSGDFKVISSPLWDASTYAITPAPVANSVP